MDSLDLHPEELFDKAARGLASADELARIDAHLGSCATCRFERLVRADFDAVAASPADLDDLVARAMSGALAQTTSPPVAEVSVPPRRRRFSPLLVAAVAMLGVSALAAVGQVSGVLPRVLETLSVKRPEAPTPPPAPRPSVKPPAPAPVAAPEPTTQLVPEPTPVVEVAPAPAPSAPVVAVQRPHAPVRTSPAPSPVVDSTPEIPRVAPAPQPVVVEPDALTLFTRAQRERVQGETAAAIRDFREVVARFPASREASLSHAALGRLLLDRGEPVSALESFDAYLSTRDTVLREDVLGGRALALQALNRVEAERAAWELLVREYPAGVYGPRARSRLEALSNP